VQRLNHGLCVQAKLSKTQDRSKSSRAARPAGGTLAMAASCSARHSPGSDR
jgi:hypothetical protein